MSSNHYELNPPPTDAISAVNFAPGSSTKLLVSCWDRHVYLYETRTESSSEGRLLQKYEHRAPVLDVCFGENEDEAFSAGLDWDVRRIDLTTGTQTVLSSHTAGVSLLAYSPSTHLLISASWDSTLHIHTFAPPSALPTSTSVLPLPAKPHALSLSPTKLVLAMSTRALHIHDLSALALLSTQSPPDGEITAEPFQRRDSSLKFMTRAVACMPNDAGFACSSIEGRVAVEWFDASPESQARKYAFKCHRQPAEAEAGRRAAEAPDGQADQGLDIVYPVHALAFHPRHGTFASGGGDGVVALWDAAAKRRIRQYQRYGASVAAMGFSGDGRMLAVGVCPGFEEEVEGVGEGLVRVYVRELGQGEARGRAGK